MFLLPFVAMAPRVITAAMVQIKHDEWEKKEHQHNLCVLRTIDADKKVKAARKQLRLAKNKVDKMCDKEGEAKATGRKHPYMLVFVLLSSRFQDVRNN